MKLRIAAALIAALALVLAACGGDDTAETTVAPVATIGSTENPIQVLFVPSVSADEIVAGGELLDETLSAATGLEFEVKVGASYAATIEEMCSSPDNTIGFIPAQGYVLANQLCGVDIELKSVRFGYDVYWTQFIVARDSDITSLDDLAGLKWAYVDSSSTSGFLVPSGIFEAEGIEPSESFEAGSHDNVARAVYNGEADFGTTFYSPPIDVDSSNLWDGDPNNADVPDDLVASCGLNATENGAFGVDDLVCDTYEVRDARRGIREEAPDIIQKVRILTLSDPIPNDGVAFGPDFPGDLKTQIVAAMVDFADSDPDGFSTAFDAYSWSGIAPTNDSEFDSIRALLQALGYSIEDF